MLPLIYFVIVSLDSATITVVAVLLWNGDNGDNTCGQPFNAKEEGEYHYKKPSVSVEKYTTCIVMIHFRTV